MNNHTPSITYRNLSLRSGTFVPQGVALMENEIIRHSSGPMMNEPDGIIPTSDDTVKVLRIQRNDSTTNHHFGEMLAAAVQLFNAADIIEKIQKGAEFVVQVPAQYQAELQAGALEMMHGAKSGKNLGYACSQAGGWEARDRL